MWQVSWLAVWPGEKHHPARHGFMMKKASVAPLLVLFFLALSGWAQSIPASEKVIEIRCLNLIDGITVRDGFRGRSAIVFSENSFRPAVESIYRLKRGIKVGCSLDGEANELNLVGYFTGETIESKTIHNAPEPEKLVFRLLGWSIKVPFREFKESADVDVVPPPRTKTILTGDDFEPKIGYELLRSDKGAIYGIGQIEIKK